MPRLFTNETPAVLEMDGFIRDVQTSWDRYRFSRRDYTAALTADRTSHRGSDVEEMETTTNEVADARNEYFRDMRDFRDKSTAFKAHLRKLIGNKYL